MSRSRRSSRIGLGDRIVLAFGGALFGFITALMLLLLIGAVAVNFQSSAPVDSHSWGAVPMDWVWWGTGASAAFAFFAPDTFADFIGAIWSAIYKVITY